jgi:hypothetical protein
MASPLSFGFKNDVTFQKIEMWKPRKNKECVLQKCEAWKQMKENGRE